MCGRPRNISCRTCNQACLNRYYKSSKAKQHEVDQHNDEEEDKAHGIQKKDLRNGEACETGQT